MQRNMGLDQIKQDKKNVQKMQSSRTSTTSLYNANSQINILPNQKSLRMSGNTSNQINQMHLSKQTSNTNNLSVGGNNTPHNNTATSLQQDYKTYQKNFTQRQQTNVNSTLSGSQTQNVNQTNMTPIESLAASIMNHSGNGTTNTGISASTQVQPGQSSSSGGPHHPQILQNGQYHQMRYSNLNSQGSSNHHSSGLAQQQQLSQHQPSHSHQFNDKENVEMRSTSSGVHNNKAKSGSGAAGFNGLNGSSSQHANFGFNRNSQVPNGSTSGQSSSNPTASMSHLNKTLNFMDNAVSNMGQTMSNTNIQQYNQQKNGLNHSVILPKYHHQNQSFEINGSNQMASNGQNSGNPGNNLKINMPHQMGTFNLMNKENVMHQQQRDLYQSRQSHREVCRDISNLTSGGVPNTNSQQQQTHQQSNIDQINIKLQNLNSAKSVQNPNNINGVQMNSQMNDNSQCLHVTMKVLANGSSRIPQPSIIASATGNMNQFQKANQDMQSSEALNVGGSGQNSAGHSGTSGNSVTNQNYEIYQNHTDIYGGTNGAESAYNTGQTTTPTPHVVEDNLQNPMIIEQKVQPSQYGQQTHQSSNRYTLTENQHISSGGHHSTQVNIACSKNGGVAIAQPQKQFDSMSAGGTTGTGGRTKSSQQIGTQAQPNNFKRMRSSGTNYAINGNNNTQNIGASSHNRYHGSNHSHGATQTGHRRYGEQNVRTSLYDKRYNEMKHVQLPSQATGGQSSGTSSQVIYNKYADVHKRAHDSNRQNGLINNQTVNKSGQNLNGTFQKSHKSVFHHHNAQTTRNGGHIANGNMHGSSNNVNSGRSSIQHGQNSGGVKGLMSGVNPSMLTHSVLNTSYNGGHSLHMSHHQYHKSTVNAQQIKPSSSSILDAQNDKENRQKLSNKSVIGTSSTDQFIKRNKSDTLGQKQSVIQQSGAAFTNQSQINSYIQAHQKALKNGSSNQTMSKNSDMEHCSSNGASQRNNSSHNKTNRSGRGSHIQKQNMTYKSQGSQSLIPFQQSTSESLRSGPQKKVNNQIKKMSEIDMNLKKVSSSSQSNKVSSGKSQKQIAETEEDTVKLGPEEFKSKNDTQPQDKTSFMMMQEAEELKNNNGGENYKNNQQSANYGNAIVQEMDARRKLWLKNYKQKLNLWDVLELRNPQSVIEFVPEIMENMKKEEQKHQYPSNFLHRSFQNEISEKYRQYLVDWLAELHYKFEMWPETLYVTVGIIDKTLMKWQNFNKSDLQCLGVTALHIAGKYEEIYPPALKNILRVIDDAVTREQVCTLEFKILQIMDFDLVWPSILRFMQRYAIIANLNKEQQIIGQMLCDFILLDISLLKKKPSLLGAVAVYATNMITNRNHPWNNSLTQCSGGIKEEEIQPLAKRLFYFIKKLEVSSLKTMFRKYDRPNYNKVVKVLAKIQLQDAQGPVESSAPAPVDGQAPPALQSSGPPPGPGQNPQDNTQIQEDVQMIDNEGNDNMNDIDQ